MSLPPSSTHSVLKIWHISNWVLSHFKKTCNSPISSQTINIASNLCCSNHLASIINNSIKCNKAVTELLLPYLTYFEKGKEFDLIILAVDRPNLYFSNVDNNTLTSIGSRYIQLRVHFLSEVLPFSCLLTAVCIKAHGGCPHMSHNGTSDS